LEKKPIPIPKGVTVKMKATPCWCRTEGQAGHGSSGGIKVEQKDGNIVAIRENDSQAAVHGLARALVNNAVEGVTRAGRANWKSLASAIAPR